MTLILCWLASVQALGQLLTAIERVAGRPQLRKDDDVRAAAGGFDRPFLDAGVIFAWVAQGNVHLTECDVQACHGILFFAARSGPTRE